MRHFIIAALAAILAACGQQKGFAEEGDRVAVIADQFGQDDELFAVRDEKRGVTCYVYKGYRKGGIDCIPDSQLQRVAP